MSGQIIGPIGVLPAASSIAFDHSYVATTAGAASLVITVPTVANNALCIVSISCNKAGGFPIAGVADSTGLWTQLAQDAASTGSFMALFYAYRSTSGGNVTITPAGSTNLDAVFASFTGFGSAQIDSGASFTQNNTATPAWTTSVATTLAVGGIGPNSGDLSGVPPLGSTATPGWVEVSSASYFNALVYKICSSTLAGETLGTDGSGGYYSSVLTAFK